MAYNELALFAGAGGGILGSLLLGHRIVCAVEIDPYCREVLLRRQEEGFLPPFPIWDDIRTFDGSEWRDAVDIVSAGFPCQPFSVAGGRKGERDDRNMWPETIRVIREVRPQYCLLENVPGLLGHAYVQRIFGDLAESGYDCQWDCISAASVGAPHIRDRLWIVGKSMCRRRNGRQDDQGQEPTERDGTTEAGANVANAVGPELRNEPGRRGGTCRSGSSELGDHGAKELVADASVKQWRWLARPGRGGWQY